MSNQDRNEREREEALLRLLVLESELGTIRRSADLDQEVSPLDVQLRLAALDDELNLRRERDER